MRLTRHNHRPQQQASRFRNAENQKQSAGEQSANNNCHDASAKQDQSDVPTGNNQNFGSGSNSYKTDSSNPFANTAFGNQGNQGNQGNHSGYITDAGKDTKGLNNNFVNLPSNFYSHPNHGSSRHFGGLSHCGNYSAMAGISNTGFAKHFDHQPLGGDLSTPTGQPWAKDVIHPGGELQLNSYSINGTGNNPFKPGAGATNTPLTRLTPQDPSRAPGARGSSGLPNPRDVSNAVLSADNPKLDPDRSSDLLWQWGQFIDHDMTLVPTPDQRNGESGIDASIDVPRGDKHLDPHGTGDKKIDFSRSNSTRDAAGNAQQPNKLTSFLDGSQVYGSDKENAADLREFSDGKLKTSKGNLLPVDETSGNFKAGDERVNEQPGLTSMQTLFVREHNRLADGYNAANPDWSDEQVYQAARSKNIAQMQAITYNEFLPHLLGNDALKSYNGYDPTTNPAISNEFATASFRFGHSMVTGDVQQQGPNRQSTGTIPLSRAFDNPDIVKEGGIDNILRGQSQNVGQALDNEIDGNLRNLLFGPPGSPGGGLDLAALNIQRGRDHELGGYNAVRESLGMRRITSWNDPVFRDGVGEKLSKVYDHPDQVDLWVGGLSEKPHGNSKMGQTFTVINADQFQRLRDGDTNFYQNQYSGEELRAIESTSLSDIIKRNTSVDDIQDDAFTVPANADYA